MTADPAGARERLAKRAKEIEAHATKYPSWNITDAVQHAADLRSLLAKPKSDPGLVEALEALKPFYGASCCLGSGRADSQQVVLQLRDALSGRFRAEHHALKLGDFRRAASVHAELSGLSAPTPGALGEER